MKKNLCIILSIIMVCGLAACGGGGTASSAPASEAPAGDSASESVPESEAEAEAPVDVITVKLAHFGTVGDPGTDAAQMFADEVTEKTGGAIVFEIYPNNELGNPPEILEQVKLGAIESCLVTHGSLDKFSKKFALPVFPYTWESYEHVYACMDGPFYEWVKDDLNDDGMHFIGAWDYGFRNLTNSRNPVNMPDDVKGLKVRTPPEIQIQECMQALGADVQQVAFSELIPALKQKTVDGQENPLATIYNNSMWECEQKYLAMTRHVYNAINLIFSNSAWDQFTDEQKAIIEEASVNAAAWMRNAVQSSEQDYITKLEAEGVEVTYPEMQLFKDQMGPAEAALADYVGDPGMIEEFQKMVEETRPN